MKLRDRPLTDTAIDAQVIAAAQRVAKTQGALAQAARQDPAVFCQFVLRNEETGRPIRLSSMHIDWHDVLSSHARVVIWSHTEAGKTQQISVGRILYEIGKNPNIRILIVSDTGERAKKIVKSIKGYIESSPEFRAVFPEVVPDKSTTTGLWRSDSFNVKRTTLAKDPTVQVVGFEGSILGARADLILIDDYLTPETTYSDHMREKGHAWLKGVIEGRRTKDGRLWFIGNAWHHDDAMHRYAKERRTTSRRYPVRDPVTGESSWPEMWSQERIDAELENRGPIEGPRTLLCKTVSDEDRRFKEGYILAALRRGDGHQLYHSLETVPQGWIVVTGVDLGVSKKDAGGETSLCTVACETKTGRRRMIGLEAGRWGGPEIVERIIDVQHRYNSIVYVESNAAQMYIKQFVNKESAVPIKALFTGANKADPAFGLESIATEMSQGKWELPNQGGILEGIMDREVMKLISEMLAYDPKKHTGDRLMSMWFAREGIRKGFAPATTIRRRRR